MTDTGDHIDRCERGLLNLGEVVFRVAVEFHGADFDQRKLAMRPNFGQVEPGDVTGDGQFAVSAGAFGMYHPLGNPLAVEVGVLFKQLPVLGQERAPAVIEF